MLKPKNQTPENKNSTEINTAKPIQIIYRLPLYNITVLSLHNNLAGN